MIVKNVSHDMECLCTRIACLPIFLMFLHVAGYLAFIDLLFFTNFTVSVCNIVNLSDMASEINYSAFLGQKVYSFCCTGSILYDLLIRNTFDSLCFFLAKRVLHLRTIALLTDIEHALAMHCINMLFQMMKPLSQK